MFDEPINFKEAEEALAKRLDTPTALKYKEIAATWDAKARSRAFFSARVADATILSELHNRVAAVIEGKMTKTQARDLIRRYFVGEGADALAALGFAPPGDGKGLTQLASAARLKLIFDTNVKMAQEVGQYQQWQEMSHVYRYGIWKAGHAEEHRQEHLARDGKAYPYDHPIWTQSPPGGEFNCHCYRILARDEDLQERGITPEPLGSNFEASSLGFDPSRDLDPPEFGKRVLPEYRERAQEKIDAFAVRTEPVPAPVEIMPEPVPAPVEIMPVAPSREKHAAKRQEQWDRAYENRLAKWKSELVSSGATDKLAEEVSKSYTPEAAKIGKPPVAIADKLFTGAYLSKDGTELVIGGQLSNKTVVASLRKAVNNLPHRLMRGKQWSTAKRHRTEREAKMLGAKLIQDKHTWKQDLAATNPNFGTGEKKWQNNCQRCVAAYEARRRGIDVVALPIGGEPAKDTVAYAWRSVYRRRRILGCEAETGKGAYDSICTTVAGMPLGARCVVYVPWKINKDAHVFIAERRKDRVALIDPQSNLEHSQGLFERVDGRYTFIVRIDNDRFTDMAKLCAKERSQ